MEALRAFTVNESISLRMNTGKSRLTKIQKRIAANTVRTVEIRSNGYCSHIELVTIDEAAFPSSLSVGTFVKTAR